MRARDVGVIVGVVAVWLAGFVAGSWSYEPRAPVAWSEIEVPADAACWDMHDEVGTIVCVAGSDDGR